jgi:ankyrin repeat protein
MADIIRLPARPDIDHYKTLAKEFQDACRGDAPGAVREWAAAWLRRRHDAQPGDVDRVVRTWTSLVKTRPALKACSLADAQFVVARIHGFDTWPAFAAHIDTLARASSGTATFEAAVDAIVGGDIATLERLLREHPDLVRQRSTREHGATLLHYVSANGVEDFRQKTPKNIVEIARLLLDAGADVNAESNSYGGHDTTFGLAATSVHPETAGVQDDLLELLLQRGALVEDRATHGAVNACLHNGRGKAAMFIAAHGAHLDLEAAAGVGRLDVVKTFVQPDGTLTNGATEKQKIDGFAWAAEYGHTAVVEYMLNAGMPLDSRLRHDGQTALHWAAWGGHADVVRLLLKRGAVVSVKDRSYDGTPLDWAIYAWGNRSDLSETEAERYYEVVGLLAGAGASLDPNWLDVSGDAERGRAKRKLEADVRMMAALKK